MKTLKSFMRGFWSGNGGGKAVVADLWVRALIGEMLGVPIGLEIGIGLAVDHEHARRALGDPVFKRIKIGQFAHRGATRAKAAGDRGKIGFRKLYDVDE